MESLTFKQDLDGIFHIDTLAEDIPEGGNCTSEGPCSLEALGSGLSRGVGRRIR